MRSPVSESLSGVRCWQALTPSADREKRCTGRLGLFLGLAARSHRFRRRALALGSVSSRAIGALFLGGFSLASSVGLMFSAMAASNVAR
jgi:hypothetical protein